MVKRSPFPIGDSLVDGDGVAYNKELDITEDEKTAGIMTPPPDRSVYPNPMRRVAKRGLNVIGWCNPFTGALDRIQVVIKSDKKSCRLIPSISRKLKKDSLVSQDNPKGLYLLCPCYIKDGYVYPSEWVIVHAHDANQSVMMDYYDWKSGTEPTGAVVGIHKDKTRCVVADYIKNLKPVLGSPLLVEGDKYLTWHATLARVIGNQWVPESWSAGFFPGDWDHVSEYRFVFSFLPFKFSKVGWFSWVCNYFKDKTYAILKYTPSKDIRVIQGENWPTAASARKLPVRILDYSGGRALCDTRDIVSGGEEMTFSGGIELWHIDNQEKLADVWKEQAEDMIYDSQGQGMDLAERVISGSISNDKIILLTAQNVNVKVGEQLFDGTGIGGWAEAVNWDAVWGPGLTTYWDKYIAMMRNGIYLWLYYGRQKNQVLVTYNYSPGGAQLYPNYELLVLEGGPREWECDRRYRVYIYDLSSRSISEVTLPGVNMQIHLRRTGSIIFIDFYHPQDSPGTLYSGYITWFDVILPELTSTSTNSGLYISGKSNSTSVEDPYNRSNYVGTRFPEHACGIINACDNLLYIPLNYVEQTNAVYGKDDPRAGQKITKTNIRLYCYGLNPDSGGNLTPSGYVTGPYNNEADNIVFYNYKNSWIDTET